MIYETTVPADWIDFNGHMRDAYYLLCVASANDALMEELGLGPAYLAATGATPYNLECHTRFLKEAHEGDRVGVHMRLLDADTKRLHLFNELRNAAGDLLALNEELLIHVQQVERPASAPFPPEVAARIEARRARDAALPAPELRAGPIGLRR
jgi:acyl-CoA thioester hydrolase